MSISSWFSLPDEHYAISVGLVMDEHAVVHYICEVEVRVPDDSGPSYAESLFCENKDHEVWLRFAGGKQVTCLGCLVEIGLLEP